MQEVAYAFVGVSLSDAKCMRGEFLNESQRDLLRLVLVSLLV